MVDLVKAVEEVLEIAKGNEPAHSIWMQGHEYVPAAALTSAKAEIERLKEENGKLRIIASYIAGTNDDEIRVALAGNPIACDSLISRAAAAMGEGR